MKKLQGQSKVINNFFNVKKYNDDYYKVVYFKYPIDNFQDEGKERKRDVNEIKLKESISRSRSTIFEYSMCNEFEYFVTLTLDKKKYDRYDLDAYIKDLGQYIRNLRRKYKADIQYLLIPELHKDGAWHLHGLIRGLPLEDLKAFKIGDKIPQRLKKMIKEGKEIFNWLTYAEKFGWVTLERVRSQTAVSKYITKYISKDIETVQLERKNKKLYYCSRGLKKAEKVKEGTMSANTAPGLERFKTFENDYLITYELNSKEYTNLFT